jgi:hypothetical protein
MRRCGRPLAGRQDRGNLNSERFLGEGERSLGAAASSVEETDAEQPLERRELMADRGRFVVLVAGLLLVEDGEWDLG